MLTILRMKSIINPPFSVFAPFFPKPNSSFTLISLASESPIFHNPVRINPSFLRIKSNPFSSTASGCSVQSPNGHMEVSKPPSGEIHVIVGPMFAGKTTTLLRRIQSEDSNGRSVAIIKSSKDTRYGLDSIVTHDGLKFPCWALKDLSSFRQEIGTDAYEQLDVIGIDEAQFFVDLYDFCQEAADCDGKTIVVAGLDGDYLRKSFGSVLDIIPLADSVTKLTARCELCGKRAYFTLRKTQETETELIGGADVYMPVCRHHYVSGQAVVEAARYVLESHKVQCSSHS